MRTSRRPPSRTPNATGSLAICAARRTNRSRPSLRPCRCKAATHSRLITASRASRSRSKASRSDRAPCAASNAAGMIPSPCSSPINRSIAGTHASALPLLSNTPPACRATIVDNSAIRSSGPSGESPPTPHRCASSASRHTGGSNQPGTRCDAASRCRSSRRPPWRSTSHAGSVGHAFAADAATGGSTPVGNTPRVARRSSCAGSSAIER